MSTQKGVVEMLNRLVGRQVFYVYCGQSTGATLDIHFTPTQRRAKALQYADLPQDKRELQGEMSLFVECAWRLVRHDCVCGSADSVEDAEKVFKAVRSLAGATLRKLTFAETDGIADPGLEFEDGSIFRLFCDTGLSLDDNCTLFAGEASVSVYSGLSPTT